jgi:tetraacyldisaccharide 4'-kinase
MYGRTRSLLLGPVLAALSALYGAAVSLRTVLYQRGILKGHTLPCPVISIGNVTLGGTGKTPMVLAVAGFFAKKGRHPAVVSRGYGRNNESETLVVSDGVTVFTNSRQGGDEPVLMGSKLAGVPVIVGAGRYEAALFALERFKSDLVILDDGFQHLKLRRDRDIVLVDAGDPFGNEKLFPAGILRERVASLKRAQAVVITRADTAREIETLKGRIRSITRAQVFTSVQRPVDLVDCRAGSPKPLSVLRGATVLVFSGIARPATFLAMVGSLGASIGEACAYPDHYEYRKSDLAEVYKKAADHRASMIVTTEKDAVRLRELKPDGIWALRIELVVAEREEWETFLLNSL